MHRLPGCTHLFLQVIPVLRSRRGRLGIAGLPALLRGQLFGVLGHAAQFVSGLQGQEGLFQLLQGTDRVLALIFAGGRGSQRAHRLGGLGRVGDIL